MAGQTDGGQAGTLAAVRAVWTWALCSLSTGWSPQGFPPRVFFSGHVGNVRAWSKTSRFKLSWASHQMSNT